MNEIQHQETNSSGLNTCTRDNVLERIRKVIYCNSLWYFLADVNVYSEDDFDDDNMHHNLIINSALNEIVPTTCRKHTTLK